MNNAYATAYKLLTLGYSVIPSGGGDKHKAPLVNWRVYQTTAPDESQLEAWERELNPVLWGIVTSDRIAVIDADTPETRAQLTSEIGEPHVTTPRGGAHWYINTTGHPVKTVAGLLPGIDVRGVGGFVNVTGTRLAYVDKGVDYPTADYIMNKLPIPGELMPWGRLPKLILAALNGSKPVAQAKQSAVIPNGQRNAKLTSIAGAMRRQGADQGAIEAALLQIKCETPLSEREITVIATSISRYEPKPDTDQPERFNLTDMGNGERLANNYRGSIRYSYDNSLWLIWNKSKWEWDTGGYIKTLAKKTARGIYNEAAKATDDKEAEAIAKYAHTSEGEARLLAMVSLAQSEPGIPVKPSELNSNPWLLNCLNGTIDLKTGNLQPHNPADLITLQVPTEYKPDAECPNWQRFLDIITNGDKKLQLYLQIAIGYSLTGNTGAQVIFLVYGLGSNGKSTFCNAIRFLLDGYAARLDAEDLMLADRHNRGQAKEGLADIQGKRFVVGSELQDGRQLNTSLVKDISGQDSVKARRLYAHEVEFTPQCKLWLYGNHKPEVKDTTLSIWRRIKLIPFTATIADGDRIDDYFERYIQPELSGILTWAVKGCLLWQKEGIKDTDAIKTATASYRADEDILADFLADCCILEQGATITKKELKDLYIKWIEDTKADNPIKAHTFKARLTERGITDGVNSDGTKRIWKGIRVRTTTDFSDKTDKANEIPCLSDVSTPTLPQLPIEITTRKRTYRGKASFLSDCQKTTGELPDCPVCGNSDGITMAPDGNYQCSCGEILKGEG